MFGQISNLLKLRIGVIMMLTALVAMVITPGQQPSVFEMLVLAFAVLDIVGRRRRIQPVLTKSISIAR